MAKQTATCPRPLPKILAVIGWNMVCYVLLQSLPLAFIDVHDPHVVSNFLHSVSREGKQPEDQGQMPNI